MRILASVIRLATSQSFCSESFSLSHNVKEAGWLTAGGLVGLIKPRQLEEIQVSVLTGSTLGSTLLIRKSFNYISMFPWPNQQPNLICLYSFMKTLELRPYQIWKKQLLLPQNSS